MSDPLSLDPTAPEGVARLARLARIDLAPAEAAGLGEHLGRVLAWVRELEAIPLEEGELLEDDALASVLREDAVRPSLAPEVAVANAPEPAPDGGFAVPAVIGGEAE